ncbi:unnamed protein product [Blepharisma stoltei]|uniref:Uncharacterized protein n=1 Tax=Blepharisma stoltei TaxID=1481888 RepID=A0AAU9JZX9_9CILI|nr:unnamed protein product [Blepharisma stoltei]
MLDIGDLQGYLEKTRDKRKLIVKFAENYLNDSNNSTPHKSYKLSPIFETMHRNMTPANHTEQLSSLENRKITRYKSHTPSNKRRLFERSFNASKKEILDFIYSKDSPKKARPLVQIPVSRIKRFRIPENILITRSYSPDQKEVKKSKSTCAPMLMFPKPTFLIKEQLLMPILKSQERFSMKLNANISDHSLSGI